MHIYYISTSIFPNRSANMVHTKKMCEAIISLGYVNSLFLSCSKINYNKRDVLNVNNEKNNIYAAYNPIKRSTELINSLLSIFIYYYDYLRNNKPDIIISRNIFSSFFFSHFTNTKIIYETHLPEKGFRKYIQRKLFLKKKLKKILISNKLKEIICNHHNLYDLENIIILHDAGTRIYKNTDKLFETKKLEILLNKQKLNKNYQACIGYFGHLYEGRGIELIKKIATMRQESAFFIFGGSEKDIIKNKRKNHPKNFFIMGHVKQSEAIEIMKKMDILLMPYQKKVSVGIKNSDTSKWMSPIKLFEYMSSNVPIISSDLPVLREVLVNNKNAFLVEPDNAYSWSNTIKRIINNKILGKNISNTSYNQYKKNFTWSIRVKRIISFLND